MSEPKTLINGVEQTTVSVNDRGLQYGDGLFETIAVHQGQALLWQQHLERLMQGCERLSFPIPDPQQLTTDIEPLIQTSTHAVLKLIVTRGAGGRGYAPPAQPDIQRICQLHDWPDYPAEFFRQGARVRLCDTRLSQQPQFAGIKHLNRLEQVLARAEWQQPEIFEGLMMDQSGNVIEATMSNLFLIKEDELITPRLLQSGISGVMRQQVIRACQELNIDCQQADISMEQLRQADACFLTNSIIGVVDVQQLEQQTFPLHPITDKIQQYLLAEQAFCRP